MNDSTVEFVDSDGVTAGTDVSATAVGPTGDLDDDGDTEAPTLTADGDVRLVEPDGSTTTLLVGDAKPNGTTIAVGDVDDDGVEDVLYANRSDDSRVWAVPVDGGDRYRVTNTSAKAVIGYGDFDANGTDDVVFLGDDSGTISYLDNGTVHDTGFDDIGSDTSIGLGALADYDLDGDLRVAVVTDNNRLGLVDHTGSVDTLNDSYDGAAKAPTGAADLTGDDDREVVHVTDAGGKVALIDVSGDVERLTDESGSRIDASSAVGAAGTQGVDLSPPVVTVASPADRTYLDDEISLAVDANEEVSEWTYSLDGGPNRSFSPNVTLTNVSEGEHMLTVYARDTAGNVQTVERTFGVGGMPSLIVFVNQSTRNLSYVTPDGTQVETDVSSDDDEIKAIGPAIHYDTDGALEIPYVKPDGSNEPALYLYHTDNGSSTVLDPNVMSEVNRGKISTADFDDDRRFDIVYPGVGGALMRVDADEEPSTIVKNGVDGTNADPMAVFGSVDIGYNEGDEADREIVWIDAGTNLKAVSQSDPDDILKPSFDNTPGSNNNVGAGEPLPLSEDGPRYFPVIDGSQHPGVLNASDGSYQALTTEVEAQKSPVGLGDVNGDGRKELLFTTKDGTVQYATADLETAPNNTVETLVVDGSPVLASGTLGVVTTHFPQRVYGEFEYAPTDTTPPTVRILEPSGTETDDDVSLAATADETVSEWTYSLDGGPERSFDGRTTLSDLSDGTHTVTVAAVDPAGNRGTATRTFEVDTTTTRSQPVDSPTATPTPTLPPDEDTPTPTVVAGEDAPTPTPTPTATATATPTPTTTAATPASETATATSTPAPVTQESGFDAWWLLLLLLAAMLLVAVLEIHLMDRVD